MPSLSVHNRFACLDNTVVPEIISINNLAETLQAEAVPNLKLRRHTPKWERNLPKRYVLAATPNAKSLTIKVELQTTDTAEVKSTSALIDSGATGQFISKQFVVANRITTRMLS